MRIILSPQIELFAIHGAYDGGLSILSSHQNENPPWEENSAVDSARFCGILFPRMTSTSLPGLIASHEFIYDRKN